jgi:2-haloacid dehalogenase
MLKAKPPIKPKVILFDVYETLLDMTQVERKINEILESRWGYILWFEMFMEYCFVDNCTAQFNDFASIARATMRMAAEIFGERISDEDVESTLGLLKQLPIHEDVQHALSRLNDMGYGIASLTNSGEKIVTERMESTGLISYFQAVLSAEQVKKYKPSKKVYLWAAKKMGVSVDEMLLVSAHGWDIAGAANAGMQTAYIKRSKRKMYPLAPQPELVCNNISDLVEHLDETFKHINAVS